MKRNLIIVLLILAAFRLGIAFHVWLHRPLVIEIVCKHLGVQT